MIRTIRQTAGLYTDVSRLDTPEGALLQADNVLLHRPGIVQPRIGFGDTTGVAARTTNFRPVRIEPYTKAGVVVVQSYDGSDWRLERLGTSTVFTTATSQIQPPDTGVRGTSQFMEARGSLYHTGADGIRKLSIAGASSYRRAGLWQTYQPLEPSFVDPGASSDRVAITADSAVAYRYCIRRTDEQGYEIRSAPSSRWIERVASGSYANGAYVEWFSAGTLYLPSDAVAGDVVELYRTRNTGSLSADPGEDYYLACTYEIDGTDVATGYITSGTMVDDVADDQLGVALYASASQFGILASKGIPPLANHLVWWGGCAWAANVIERHALTVTINKVAYSSGATQKLEGEGLCYLDNGSYTGVSGNDLTGVTFSAGFGWDAIAVGMWIGDTSPSASAGRISIGSKITAFDSGAGTITLDTTPSGTGSFKCGDIIDVDGQDFYAYGTYGPASRWVKIDLTETDLGERCYKAARSLAEAVSIDGARGNVDCYVVKDEVLEGGEGSLIFVSTVPKSTANFSIQCATRGAAFAPDITAALDAETDVGDPQRKARVRWSAVDEPEAWPPANSTDIGQQDYGITALVPLRDALLVFKEDGLYRITGAAPSSWVVDELDATLRLVAPEATCVLDGTCYAWTDRGVVAVTSGGVADVVSKPIARTLRELQRNYPLGNTDPKRGVFMAAHRRLGLVILWVTATTTAEYSDDEAYVWHVHTGRWSRWRRSDRCAAYDPAEDRMLVSPGVSGWEVLYERSDEDSAKSYRDVSSLGLTISKTTGTEITIATSAFGAYTPAACDVMVVKDVSETNLGAFVVESVTVDGSDYDIVLSGTPSGGTPATADWHQGYACTMIWHPLHAQGLGHRWQELHAEFGPVSSQYLTSVPVDMGGGAHRDSGVSSVQATITPDVALSEPLRAGLPLACVRTPHYYPYAKICVAGVLWELLHLYVHTTATSRRVNR